MESRDCSLLRPYLSLFILLPANPDTTTQELNQMICDVNAEQVLAEEILSDHVYLFSLARKSLVIPDIQS